MRHLLANLAVYVLAVGLVLSALLFAWVRSAQIVIAVEPMIEPQAFATAKHPDEFDWRTFGERVYVANCMNCHGSGGQGRDVYPPLRGQAEVFAAPGGRDYLVRLVVYGLYTGEYGAPMPPMPNLTDVQIAAATNYMLTRFDDPARLADPPELFVPRDVRRIRGEAHSERAIGRMRPAVPLPRDLGRE